MSGPGQAECWRKANQRFLETSDWNASISIKTFVLCRRHGLIRVVGVLKNKQLLLACHCVRSIEVPNV